MGEKESQIAIEVELLALILEVIADDTFIVAVTAAVALNVSHCRLVQWSVNTGYFNAGDRLKLAISN